jgi:hypothetical protein
MVVHRLSFSFDSRVASVAQPGGAVKFSDVLAGAAVVKSCREEWCLLRKEE